MQGLKCLSSRCVERGRQLSIVLITVAQEIESWVAALKFYDGQEYENALEKFDEIADTSKIFFNIGIIHATLGEHEKAVSNNIGDK